MHRLLWLPLVVFFTACGPRTMQVRLKDAERAAQRADQRLEEAQAAADAAQPEKLQRALDAAKKELNDKDFSLASGAHEYLDRYNELVGRVPTVKQDREHRDLVQRIEAVKAQLAPGVQALSDAQAALPMSAPTAAAIADVELAAKALTDALAPQQALLSSTPESAQWTRARQDAAVKALDAAARGRKGLAFLEGPAAAWREGVALQADAKPKAPAEQAQALAAAKEKLTACATGARTFADDKSIGALAFTMPDGKTQTPTQLAATCQKALKPLESELRAAQKKAKKK